MSVVHLGEVAAIVRRHHAAAKSGPSRYVGLENLTPGRLKVSQWFESSTISGPSLEFHPGEVLFGKLRPNLRKSAIAEWTGACSPEILVLSPSDDGLSSEYLALLTQSDGFVKWAIKTATGSKMPRTSWAALASYRFDLPSVDRQQALWRVASAFADAADALAAEVDSLWTARNELVQSLLYPTQRPPAAHPPRPLDGLQPQLVHDG